MASGKFTVIEMVQKVLESLGSDEVNSLDDTVEATQVGRLLEDMYYELLNQKEWPWLKSLRQLESVSDSTRPNFLRIPDTVTRIDNFRYDCTDRVTEPLEPLDIQSVTWLHPEDFLKKVQGRSSDSDNVDEITTSEGIRLLIFNDACPTWWTSFDDEFVVTDSYDVNIETTLEANRSQVLVKEIPTFTRQDSFVADAPANFFQLWLAETKKTAYNYWRQEVSPTDEQRARRGLAVLRRDAQRTNNDDGKVKFGRRPV